MTYQNLHWNKAKVVLRIKFIASFLKKNQKSKINNPIIHLTTSPRLEKNQIAKHKPVHTNH